MNTQSNVASLFARFTPVVDRIAAAGPKGSRVLGMGHRSWADDARDILSAAADDLHFGDDLEAVASKTAASLREIEVRLGL